MSCLFIIEKDDNFKLKYLLAILNSKFALNWFCGNGKKRGGGVDIGVDKLRSLPIPNYHNQDTIINIVDKILELTTSNDYIHNEQKQQAVDKYGKEIDNMVYKLYDLTYEEVKSIDSEFSMSEEEYNNFSINIDGK